MRMKLIRIPHPTWKRLKQISTEREKPMSRIVEEAVEEIKDVL